MRFTRETFIALRARRQGHQIARAILNPPVSVPPPAGPTAFQRATVHAEPAYRSVEASGWSEGLEQLSENKWERRVMISAGILFLIIAAVNMFWDWHWM